MIDRKLTFLDHFFTAVGWVLGFPFFIAYCIAVIVYLIWESVTALLRKVRNLFHRKVQRKQND